MEQKPIQEIREQRERESSLTEHDLHIYEKIFGIDVSQWKGKLVLDIGSGINEQFSKEAAQKGVKVISMRVPEDIEGTQIDKKFFENWQKKSVFARGQQMPYEGNSFDREVALNSVPFYLPLILEEYKIFFSEVIRTLKPGGQAFFFPILKNFHEDLDKRAIPREFISLILNQFSDSIKYKIEEAYRGDRECRLVITKNNAR